MRPGLSRTVRSCDNARRDAGVWPAAASMLCLLFIACSSSSARQSRPPSPTPSGRTSGVMSDWRLTGRADSKSRCDAMAPPMEMRKQRPSYSQELREKGIAGIVVLQATVSLDGVPAAVQVVKSADPLLSPLAIEALRAWQFRPASCDGAPIDAYVTVTFTFELR